MSENLVLRHTITSMKRNLAKHYIAAIIAHQVYMYDLQIKSIVKYTYL